MSLKVVRRTAWTSMLSRVCNAWTRKNSREIHLHFTSLSAASAMARINEYGGTVLRCLYSKDEQTMFMCVQEPTFAEVEYVRNDTVVAFEAEECTHDDFEDGICLDCNAHILDTAHAYSVEHDSNEMER